MEGIRFKQIWPLSPCGNHRRTHRRTHRHTTTREIGMLACTDTQDRHVRGLILIILSTGWQDVGPSLFQPRCDQGVRRQRTANVQTHTGFQAHISIITRAHTHTHTHTHPSSFTDWHPCSVLRSSPASEQTTNHLDYSNYHPNLVSSSLCSSPTDGFMCWIYGPCRIHVNPL